MLCDMCETNSDVRIIGSDGWIYCRCSHCGYEERNRIPQPEYQEGIEAYPKYSAKETLQFLSEGQFDPTLFFLTQKERGTPDSDIVELAKDLFDHELVELAWLQEYQWLPRSKVNPHDYRHANTLYGWIETSTGLHLTYYRIYHANNPENMTRIFVPVEREFAPVNWELAHYAGGEKVELKKA